MKLVDLFCGSGGFSLGAHQAGFKVAAAYDIDPILTSSYTRNFQNTQLHLVDIAQLSGQQVAKSVGAPIDGVFGGPPCQGFSSIGRRDSTDVRRTLLGHFFRLVSELKPAFFVMENVLGLAYEDARSELNDAIAVVAGSYDVIGPQVWDASQFGAPTKRPRIFIIGIDRERCDPFAPEDMDIFRRPAATVRDAILDLQGARKLNDQDGFDHWKIMQRGSMSSYARQLRSSNGQFTGHRFTSHTESVVERFSRVKPGSMDKIGRHPRLAWEGQCPTLRAGTGADRGSYQSVRPIHPSENRVITVREAARLQGFPDTHIFHPTVWHSFRMIGNSVSPIIAKAVFEAIRLKVGNFPKHDQMIEGEDLHQAVE
ncbi:DNA cytosine methyltransferase [Novosphingobium lentum]|uniref:DNA cytosine methyltransferase n=1 Tax=Novosphingobium lentum TaxID=145287 RepID=UPI000836B8BE|nr:DNA cytosine methyltransferase [Novosphingobium lentum]